MTTLAPGTRVLGEYRITKMLHEDAAWVQVLAAHNDGSSLELRILRSGLVRDDVVGRLFDEFDALANAPRKYLRLPFQIASDANFPLVLVYEREEAQPLLQVLAARPQDAVELWQQASEALHSLHNKGLVHGAVVPQHWSVSGGTVRLGGFGYGILLAGAPLSVRSALQKSFQGFLAPETIKGEVIRAGDVYSFARCVASWRPSLMPSPWFQESAAGHAELRPRAVRGAWKGLEAALQNVQVLAPPEPEQKKEAKKPWQESVERGGVVATCAVSLRVEPVGAGAVQAQALGEGGEELGQRAPLTPGSAARYPSSSRLKLWAQPETGWKFEGWGGDLSGQGGEALLRVAGPKSLVARFERLPAERPMHQQWTLSVRVEPVGSGVVMGAGQYFSGENAVLQARAHEGYRFESWRGEVLDPAQVRQPMLRLSVQGNLALVARFGRARLCQVSTRCEPIEGGSVIGGGVHTQGQNATIRAEPAPQWRFSHWSGGTDGSVGGRANPIEFEASTSMEVTAHFTKSLWADTRHSGTQDTSMHQPAGSAGSLGAAFISTPNAPAPEAGDSPGASPDDQTLQGDKPAASAFGSLFARPSTPLTEAQAAKVPNNPPPATQEQASEIGDDPPAVASEIADQTQEQATSASKRPVLGKAFQ